MDYKKYTYEELDKKYLSLSEKRDSLMDECAKSGLPFNEYVEKGGSLHEACLDCGFCESKCPQHLKIHENLEKVEKIFAK